MGWFGGSSSNDKKAKSTSDDPLSSLDPELREFLKKESPVKYDTSNPPAPPIPRAAEPKTEKKAPAPAAAAASTKTETASEESNEPRLPQQSLFPDGRYAHIWKTYQPQAEAEAASKSDQEKIADIVEGYKYRRGQIGRAALENCAMEQWEVNRCFSNGSMKDTLTMCKRQNRELSQCYMMQSKFLRALGYLSNFDDPEQDERIQMHADTLYQRMREQEKAIETAKAEKKPIPKFPPLLSSDPIPSDPKSPHNTNTNTNPNPNINTNTSSLPITKIKPSDFPPDIQEQIKERLKDLKGNEREIEERAVMEEIRAGEKVVGKLGEVFGREREERRKRREAGKETFYDKIATFVRGS